MSCAPFGRAPLLLQMVPLTAAVVKGYQRKDAGGHKTPAPRAMFRTPKQFFPRIILPKMRKSQVGVNLTLARAKGLDFTPLAVPSDGGECEE